MYTWSGSQCAMRLCSSPGWRADKKPRAGARSWLYLPGAEGWHTPDESHRQLHQERTDRMCTSCHRKGRPVSSGIRLPPYWLHNFDWDFCTPKIVSKSHREGEFMSALWPCVSVWSAVLFQEKGHLFSVVSLVLYRAEHCLCWTLTTHLCLVKDRKSMRWRISSLKNHHINVVWGLRLEFWCASNTVEVNWYHCIWVYWHLILQPWDVWY